MPAAQRKTAAPKPPTVPVRPAPEAPVAFACTECFPGGRLPDGVFTAGCEHGVWTAPRT